jgi:dihydroorotase
LRFRAASSSKRFSKLKKQGFIKEGYFADLVIVNAGLPWSVKRKYAKCGWSPLKALLSSRELHILL